MKLLPEFHEKRRSYRWPVTDKRQAAELRFGEKQLPVQLLDISAGGFRVLCEQPLGIEAFADGVLCVGEDWFEVRVSNIKSLKPPLTRENDGQFFPADTLQASMQEDSLSEPLPEKLPTRYCIGLARSGDLLNPQFRPADYSLAGLRCQLGHVSSVTMLVIAGLMLAVIVVAVPLVAMKFISFNTVNVKIKEVIQRWDQQTMSALQKRDDYRLPAEVRNFLQGMPGATPFALPEVAKYLQLTESQQTRIQELIDASDSAANGLIKKEVLDNSRIKVLELLDNNQKKKWRTLSGESEESAKKGRV